MIIRDKIKIAVGVGMMMIFAQSAPAQEMAAHQITVKVPHILEIISSMENFTLNFNDYVKGSESNTQQVVYSLRSNNLERNSGVLQAQVSTSLSGIDLAADVGAYAKRGGNASLVEAEAGFIPLGEGWTNLCNRQVDEGEGKVTSGDLTVDYKAIAREDLAHQNATVQVRVILVDV